MREVLASIEMRASQHEPARPTLDVVASRKPPRPGTRRGRRVVEYDDSTTIPCTCSARSLSCSCQRGE